MILSRIGYRNTSLMQCTGRWSNSQSFYMTPTSYRSPSLLLNHLNLRVDDLFCRHWRLSSWDLPHCQNERPQRHTTIDAFQQKTASARLSSLNLGPIWTPRKLRAVNASVCRISLSIMPNIPSRNVHVLGIRAISAQSRMLLCTMSLLVIKKLKRKSDSGNRLFR